MTSPLHLAHIQAARERIADRIYRSPCPHSEALSEMCGAKVYVKLENLQQTGAFKERGAANRLAQLTDDERRRGVVTASAGNHGLGLAHQARLLGISTKVVMPVRAPLVKQTNVKRLGAEVILAGETYEQAVARGHEIGAEEDRTYIHGFDDVEIMAGQGTIGLEVLEEVPDLDAIVVPVGGGGLIAGIGTAIKAQRPAVQVIGVEPANYASMQAACDHRSPTPIQGQPTIADGLAVNQVGALSFQAAHGVVDRLVTVSEDDIAQAILILLEVEKTVVEGAGASPLAALLHADLDLTGKTVVLPLCGGNIDMTMVAHILERGLAKDGRLVWLRTYADDTPGSLAELADLVAKTGSSVKDLYHNRAFGRVEPGKVEINLVLETRGHEHIAEVLTALRARRFKVATFDEAL